MNAGRKLLNDTESATKNPNEILLAEVKKLLERLGNPDLPFDKSFMLDLTLVIGSERVNGLFQASQEKVRYLRTRSVSEIKNDPQHVKGTGVTQNGKIDYYDLSINRSFNLGDSERNKFHEIPGIIGKEQMEDFLNQLTRYLNDPNKFQKDKHAVYPELTAQILGDFGKNVR